VWFFEFIHTTSTNFWAGQSCGKKELTKKLVDMTSWEWKESITTTVFFYHFRSSKSTALTAQHCWFWRSPTWHEFWASNLDPQSGWKVQSKNSSVSPDSINYCLIFFSNFLLTSLYAYFLNVYRIWIKRFYMMLSYWHAQVLYTLKHFRSCEALII